MYKVYILRSHKDNKVYIGCTKNIVRRLAQHNDGRVKSTKHRLPMEIIKVEDYDTLPVARNRENYLKRLKGGNEFKKIIGMRL